MNEECITLTESRSTIVRLQQAQASFLTRLGQELASKKAYWGATSEESQDARSRTIIRCNPTGDGFYNVTVDNAVGVIGVDQLRINVGPKIDLRHLVFLLQMSGALPRSTLDVTTIAQHDDLTQLLSAWFVMAVNKVLRGDLLRDYHDITDEITRVRGLLDVAATAGNYYRGSLLMTCRFDEFDEDTPLNRILKGAARVVVRSPLCHQETRRNAKRILNRLDMVSDFSTSDMAAAPDRRAHSYSDAITLSKALLRSEVRSIEFGSSRGHCFLIPTPGPVEDAIRLVLSRGLSNVAVVSKAGFQLPGSFLTLNPDLRFDQLGAVGDVKYKTYDGTWSRGDLYQSVAFAAALRYEKAAIVSFTMPSTPQMDALQFGDIKITSLTWQYSNELDPQTSATQLVADAKKWLLEESGQRAQDVA